MIYVLQISIIGIFSTLAMTVFSYCVSLISKSKFEEPQLINTLIDRMPNSNHPHCRGHIIGWFLHILIGIFFVAIYKIGLLFSVLTLSVGSGIVFGFLAGIIGVCGWHLTFKLHPDPPKIDKATYYIQLTAAHIIFGIGSVLLFNEWITACL